MKDALPGREEIQVLKQYVLIIGALIIVNDAWAGDGTIVIQREVQPRVAFRPTMVPDPHPVSVNPNVSSQVNHQMRGLELNDSDFAHVTSGQRLNGTNLAEGHLPGLESPAGARLPGLSAGRASSGGNSISSQVNRSVQKGLAPLQNLTGGR